MGARRRSTISHGCRIALSVSRPETGFHDLWSRNRDSTPKSVNANCQRVVPCIEWVARNNSILIPNPPSPLPEKHHGKMEPKNTLWVVTTTGVVYSLWEGLLLRTFKIYMRIYEIYVLRSYPQTTLWRYGHSCAHGRLNGPSNLQR